MAERGMEGIRLVRSNKEDEMAGLRRVCSASIGWAGTVVRLLSLTALVVLVAVAAQAESGAIVAGVTKE